MQIRLELLWSSKTRLCPGCEVLRRLLSHAKGLGFNEDKGELLISSRKMVLLGIWRDFTVVAMWKLGWSREEDQLDLYDCGNLGKTDLVKGRDHAKGEEPKRQIILR